MKKCVLFVFILTFIFGLFALNANSASAYDAGCTSAGPYSVTTGQLCYGSQYGAQYGSQYNGYSGNTLLSQYLTIGSRGNDVITLQQILKNQGYYTGIIDGIYGRRTARAVREFQDDNGFSITGNLDTNTLQLLNNLQVSFTVPAPYPPSQSPVVSGVSGPQSLSINQQGTWTVTAYSFNSGNLTYSVNWGDQQFQPLYLNNNSAYSVQQNATFTHTYSQAGTYTPVFTVTNTAGQTAQASLNVSVGGVISNQIPVVFYLAPNYGRVGTQVTINGSGFAYNGNTVNFGSTTIPNLYSSNGTSVTFTIPQVGTIYCIQAPCTQNFNVSVSNSNGTSTNASVFTVLY